MIPSLASSWIWPGVTQLFACVSIMEATTAVELKYMVIESGIPMAPEIQ
jgi:hypothetical protein